jgi:hypothetical protein
MLVPRVGVTGHRDLIRGRAATVDQAALGRKVREVLETVALDDPTLAIPYNNPGEV